MKTGILFMAADRTMPTLAEFRLTLGNNRARIATLRDAAQQRALTDPDPSERMRSKIEYDGHVRYLTQGPDTWDDTRLAAYLQAKERGCLKQHYPIDCYPEARMGLTCEHPRMYGIIFNNLDLGVAESFCRKVEEPTGALDNELNPVMRLLRIRSHRLDFASLSNPVRRDIQDGKVPTVLWNPLLMVANG